jgi:uncharacterized protein
MMKKYWIWLMPALFFVGCKTAQKATYKPEELVPSEKSLFWKISGNGLKKPSFLYGTIHIIPKSEYKMPVATQRALDNMQRVAFEIDMKEMTNIRTQLSLMTKAFMAGGKTLKDLLPAEDYTFVRKKMDEKGLPAGMMERIKPMFLSMMFAGDEGGGGLAGGDGKMTSVEMELYRVSKKRKLESAGLETAAYQMSIFDSIPYVDQAKMLLQSLRSTSDEKGGDELERMLKLYREQDINAMQSAIGDEEGGMSNYQDLLLNKRNRNWIPVMGRMMREKPTLFAVGAGHLGGEQGVVALLRKEGYRVEADF